MRHLKQINWRRIAWWCWGIGLLLTAYGFICPVDELQPIYSFMALLFYIPLILVALVDIVLLWRDVREQRIRMVVYEVLGEIITSAEETIKRKEAEKAQKGAKDGGRTTNRRSKSSNTTRHTAARASTAKKQVPKKS